MTFVANPTLRTNIRNFLVPLTMVEMQAELDISVEIDDTLRAEYIEEYICEVMADFNGCDISDFLLALFL